MTNHHIYLARDEKNWVEQKADEWDDSKSGVVRQCINAVRNAGDGTSVGLTTEQATEAVADLRTIAHDIELKAEAEPPSRWEADDAEADE